MAVTKSEKVTKAKAKSSWSKPSGAAIKARAHHGRTITSVTIKDQGYAVTPIFDAFFTFVAKRFQVHQRRIAGEERPWTTDPTLQQYPFTNVFRSHDRVSQTILKEVIRKGDQCLDEMCFRVMLFRAFSRTETWNLFVKHFGTPTWHDFDVKAYEDVLLNGVTQRKIYTPAYYCPAPKLGGQANAANHLRLVYLMMKTGLPGLLKTTTCLKDAHGLVSMYPSLSEFIGQQLLLDLNMTPHFNWHEDEWVMLGPGSKDCLEKMFSRKLGADEALDAVAYLFQTQHAHFARLRIGTGAPGALPIPRLHPALAPGLSMVDIEHALCECAKYTRATHPEHNNKHTHVSRRNFEPDPRPLSADVPPHWLTRAPRAALPKPGAFKQTDAGEDFYEVSHIVAEKRHETSKDPKYLLRWAGWGQADDTWEAESTLDQAPEVLKVWKVRKAEVEELAEEMRTAGFGWSKAQSKKMRGRKSV